MSLLCYHAIDSQWESSLSMPPEVFAKHCEWLHRNTSVLNLPGAVDRLDASGRLPRKMSALTFDDGFASVYEHAWPILQRYRLPATIFLVAETLTSAGRDVDWVDDPPAYPLQTLTLDQVLEMQQGGVLFGSHSYSHRTLTELGEEACERDLRTSRETLEDLLGGPVPYLAYPRGIHDAGVRRAAARAGYSWAFTLPETAERASPLSVPRVGVHRHNGVPTLRVKLTRRYLYFKTSARLPQLALRKAKRLLGSSIA